MAQTNVYLKLTGIDGESLDDDHPDWIEVHGWSWGVDNQADFALGQGGQATQAHIAPLTCTKHIDKASVPLFKACTTGQHLGEGTLSLMKLDGTSRVEYLKYHYRDVMVKGVHPGGAGADTIGMETISLVFAELKAIYKLQQDTGSAKGSQEFQYDIQKSKAS
jgi:type VI secretion system secreted protein Hcp